MADSAALPELTDGLVAAMVGKLRQRADGLSLSVAMNGGFGDGGRGALLAQIDAFLAGREGRLPPGWDGVFAAVLAGLGQAGGGVPLA